MPWEPTPTPPALQVNCVIANAANPASAAALASTTSGSSTIVLSGTATTSQLCPGTVVNLTGLPANDKITGIIDLTHFTVALPATSTQTNQTATYASNTGLTKNGGGVLDLGDGNNQAITNTFSGPVTLNGGLTMIKSDLTLGPVPTANTPNMIVFNGGELRSTATITLSSQRGWYLGTQGGWFTYKGGATLSLNSYLVQGPGSITFSDFASGTANNNAINLNFAANSAALTYSGATTFQVGSVLYPAQGSLQYFTNANELPAASPVTVKNVSTANINFLNLNGTNQAFGSLAGNGDIVTNSGNPTLTVGANNLSTVYSGDLGHSGMAFAYGASTNSGDHGTTTANISLVKNGGGVFTMTGSSQYAGGTTINGGGILASNTAGSALGTGNVAVNSGAFLGGSGTVAANVTLNAGGILSPATTPTGFSNLTITGSLTVAGGSNFNYNLSGTGSQAGADLVTVSGGGKSITLNGTADLLNISVFNGYSPSLPAVVPILIANNGATLTDNVRGLRLDHQRPQHLQLQDRFAHGHHRRRQPHQRRGRRAHPVPHGGQSLRDVDGRQRRRVEQDYRQLVAAQHQRRRLSGRL